MRPSYHLVPDSENEPESQTEPKTLPSSRPRPSRTRQFAQILLILLLAATSFLGGAFLERRRSHAAHPSTSTGSTEKHSDTVPTVSLAYTVQNFHLDPAFATIPNATGEPEPAWDSLIPNGLGYVKHPDMAPELSVISAFHQLHCLYTLRRAYFADQKAPLQDFDFGLQREPHALHCFEYLRQSLMCSADSTIEPAEKASQGVEFLGWGFGRQCRDYEGLKSWAEKYRAFDAHGFLAKDLPGHGHGHGHGNEGQNHNHGSGGTDKPAT